MFLTDPAQLVDDAAVADLELALERTTDPIERLKTLAQLDRLRHPAEAPYKQAFIEHAKAWAETHDVPPPAFAQMGVPPHVLDEAGLALTGSIGSPDRPAVFGRAVQAEHVAAVALRQRGAFTQYQLRAATGASPMTIRKALTQLIAAGKLHVIGPDPDWTKPGRAPTLYELRER